VHAHVFREYDIRGKVGTEFILEEVYPVTRAIAAFFLQQNPRLQTVVVAWDGRVHSEYIKTEVTRALYDSGLTVVLIGLCPTPVMYFALHYHKEQYDAGIMITASHNGPEYNGLKINLGTRSVWGKDIQEIYSLYQHKADSQKAIDLKRPFALSKRSASNFRVPCHRMGGNGYERPSASKDLININKARQDALIGAYDIQDIYLNWLADHFKHLRGSDIAVIFDCASGATGPLMQRLIDRMEWDNARLLHATIDGTFLHHEADPTVEKNMEDLRTQVQMHQAALGIGFDGDGDRMAPITQEGILVYGDQLLTIFAQSILNQGLKSRSPKKIVYDIKCSQMVADTIVRYHGTPIVSPSGHAVIKNALRNNKAVLAGELSCHFFFADRYFGYDDGIYAALRLLELLQERSLSLQELYDTLPRMYSMPEARIVCAELDKKAIIERVHYYFAHDSSYDLLLLDGVRVQTPHGWGIIRASNTQAVLSMRCESTTQEGLQHMQRLFDDALKYAMEKNL